MGPFLNYFIALSCFIQPTTADYITTYVYPDTLEQCASYLVPITNKTSYSNCVDILANDGSYTSVQTTCVTTDSTKYEQDIFLGAGCKTYNGTTFISLTSNCTYTNNIPEPFIATTGSLNVIQSCEKGSPNTNLDAGLPTLIITEYATHSCDDVSSDYGSSDSSPVLSNTTSLLNQCQNTGGNPNSYGSSFLIQCNSTTAYISNFDGYGCKSTQLTSIAPLFQIGCSTNATSNTSISVSCTTGSTPSPSPLPPPSPSQPSNDIWTIITQSPYFIDGIAVCAGLLGGGFIVCICICMCRRRNRKNRNKRPTSPSPYSTSVQSNAVVVDGIGTPLRSDVLPGLSTPSSQSQSNQGGIRTPLLSQSGGEERGFVDDDSEA